MRAVVLREARLEVRATADPSPGPGEMLLRTLSTAICASDVHFMDHPEVVANDGTGRFAYDPDRDIVLGHEFVGEVVAHGPAAGRHISRLTRLGAVAGDPGSQVRRQVPIP